jgi:hypothetical protein
MKQNNILISETKKEAKETKETKKEIKDNVTEEMVHLEFIEKSINFRSRVVRRFCLHLGRVLTLGHRTWACFQSC